MPAPLQDLQGIFAVAQARCLGAGEAAEGDFARRGLPGGFMGTAPAISPPAFVRIGFQWRPAVMARWKRQPRIFCIDSISSQRPNFRPDSRSTPASTNPADLCSAIEAPFSASIAPTTT